MRLAVLASHEGTVMQTVLDACAAGELPAQVVLVISNNSRSGALRRAREHGIPHRHMSGVTHPHGTLDQAMLDALRGAEADWVLLAGYMRPVGEAVLAAYRNRIVNTHPALLPKFGGQGFYGRRVHEAVIAAGETESGATVHLVESEYDTGPVVSQVRVPVRPDDTVDDLEDRVRAAERGLVVDTLRQLATGRAGANR